MGGIAVFRLFYAHKHLQIGHIALDIFPPASDNNIILYKMVHADLWQSHKCKIIFSVIGIKESRKSRLDFCGVFNTVCERNRCVCFNPNLRIIGSETDYGVHRIVSTVKCNLVISLGIIPRTFLDFFRVDLNTFYKGQQLIKVLTVCNSHVSIGSLYFCVSCRLRSC